MNGTTYFCSLQPNIQDRYLQKIKLINNFDPYSFTEKDFNITLDDLPAVSYLEIIIYFAVSNSFYTGDQLRSYKALEAYTYCKAGFVANIKCAKIQDNFLVIGEVKHSMKMSSPNLKPWIILRRNGSIACAHCTCMAGLGEVCSHAAAISFALYSIHEDEEISCTDKLCQWNVPKNISIGPMKMKEINWGTPLKSYPKPKGVPALEGQQLLNFLQKVDEIEPDAVILRVYEPFASKRAPKEIENLPIALDTLYDAKYENNCLEELRNVEINLKITLEEQEAVRRMTLNQSKCSKWFTFRIGRVTASTFKRVCCTKIEDPSESLIKSLCYSGPKNILKINAIDYGVKHEETARIAYAAYMKKSQHVKVIVEKTGFTISTLNPEFGASPDALVQCECCGKGVVEIKCPYKMRFKTIALKEFASFKNTCLIENNNSYTLDRRHEYYYQVQFQMYCLERNYCDFVVWSNHETLIERIPLDMEFLETNLPQALHFHKMVIIPELLGRYYTKSKDSEVLHFWCNCLQPDSDREMIKCSNEFCPVQWFHLDCVNKFDVLNTKFWVCEDCTIQLSTAVCDGDDQMEWQDSNFFES